MGEFVNTAGGITDGRDLDQEVTPAILAPKCLLKVKHASGKANAAAAVIKTDKMVVIVRSSFRQLVADSIKSVPIYGFDRK